jgi:hypothetical protein
MLYCAVKLGLGAGGAVGVNGKGVQGGRAELHKQVGGRLSCGEVKPAAGIRKAPTTRLACSPLVPPPAA